MKRRTFLKAAPAAALAPAVLPALLTEEASGQTAKSGKRSAGKQGETPDYAGKLGYSDMTSFDADGKPRPVGSLQEQAWVSR